jgi:hypothetical protein
MKTFYLTLLITVFLLVCKNGMINGQTKFYGFAVNPNESSNFRLQIQGGLGTLKGLTYNESEQISTVGVPLKLGLKWLPSTSLGIGVDLQAKLNSKYSIYMIMASLEIGKLRNK